jgi:hypothetical protein
LCNIFLRGTSFDKNLTKKVDLSVLFVQKVKKSWGLC